MAQPYRKHFIPLESNPSIFTSLIHKLGVSPSLCFQDVLSLDDPDLLGFLPRPVHALILVFPTTEAYEKRVTSEESGVEEYCQSGDGEEVVFFRQTINNACGLYAILHAVCNSGARNGFEQQSTVGKLLDACLPLRPDERALLLENDSELEGIYAEVAKTGDTEAPDNAEDEIDFHYIALVKSHVNSHLYQFDGDRKRPIDLGLTEAEDDVLSEQCLSVIRSMMTGEEGNVNFNLMALTSAE